MLVLLLLIHTVLAKEFSDTQDHPIFRNVSSCPEVGYFLSSGAGENIRGKQCHLCFCQNNGVAVCWKHQNSRCDAKTYVHDKKIRPRRSPGFADLFFKDAARDMFQKQTPEECKPFQGSYSIGCPPADWCIGCTVCDCNANGRWDCHVLSFCPGDKRKKSSKKRRTVINEMKMKPPLHYSTPTPKPTTKRTPPTKPTTKRAMQTKRQARKYMTVQSKMKGTAPTKSTPRKTTPIQSKVTMRKKPTTRRSTTTNQPKTKRTVLTKPTINKTVQTKPAVKKNMDTKSTVKKTMASKQAITRTATQKPVKNTTINKLNKVRQINVKLQNLNTTKIKTNQMMRINTKQRKDTVNNSLSKKPVNSAKPVQKKTLTANVNPAMKSFQKVTKKPMKNNVNNTKTVTNTMISVKNISSKIMKSSEKIINEKQKSVSKLIKISDKDVQPKNKIINNFRSEPQRNVTVIETTNKIKEKIVSNKKYGMASKRLNRKKRYTNLLLKTNK
ncbi:probable serine/threonine-protein kinase samkC [Aricia agestis]|uniref:probable serine/threonine-protein kinase samkC n=1 Tax=Aricia agestis TaxID=91739 RepID=UPI001C20234A|nr:probable serine/threonine-protein kinase samkC [Aricia agestis]